MALYGAVPSGDVTKFRAQGAVWAYLTAVPPTTVVSGQVNQALTESSFPAGQLTLDNISGDLADAKVGQDVWIGTAAGLHDVWHGRVRLASSGSTLYVAELGHGEPGLAKRTHVRVANNHYVTVIEPISVWYAFPRILISGGSSTIYMDYDVAYSDQGTQPPPVAVIVMDDGTLYYQHCAAFVDTGTNKLRLTLDAADSFPVAPGVGISSYLWTLPGSGATIVSGTVNDASLQVDFDPGAYWVQCVVTDGNSKTGTARRFVRAHTATGDNAPLPVWGYSAVRDCKGQRATVQVHYDDYALTTLTHGGMVLLWDVQRFGDALNASSSHTFAGWLVRESTGHLAGYPTMELEVLGPGHLLDLVPAVPQRVEVAASPAAWHQVRSGLNNLPGTTWWLLRWHTNLTQLFDLKLFDNAYTAYGEAWSDTRQEGFGGETLGAPTLGGQLGRVADTVKANFGSLSDGTLVLERNPAMIRSGRSSWPTRFTLTSQDWERVEGAREHRLRVGVVQADAFAYVGGTSIPLRSQAPDYTPGQAPGRDDIQAAAILSQDELNYLSGHWFAYVNNPLPDIRIPLTGAIDCFEPAAMDMVDLQVAATEFAHPIHGLGWRRLFALHSDPGAAQTLDMLAKTVTLDLEGTVKRVGLLCEAVTEGDPGRTLPIEQPGASPEPDAVDNGYVPPDPTPVDYTDYSVDDEGDAQVDANTVYLIARTGSSPNWNYYLVASSDFISGDDSPTWAIKSGPHAQSTAQVFDFQLDPADPANDAYLFRSDGVYRTTNLTAGSPTFTQQNASNPAGSSSRYVLDSNYAGWIGVPNPFETSPDYNYFTYTTDYGANWSDVSVFDYDPGNAYLGLDVDKFGGGRLFMGVVDDQILGGSDQFMVYRASTWGESAGYWSQMAATFTAALNQIVIPRRRGTANNNPADYAIGGIGTAAGTFALYKTTDGWATKTDITPSVSGTSYAASQISLGESLWADYYNGDRLFMVGESAGGAIRILQSTDEGSTWSIMYNAGTTPMYVAQGYTGGSDDLVIGGQNVLQHSANRGVSWTDKLGNLASLLSATPTVLKYRVVVT